MNLAFVRHLSPEGCSPASLGKRRCHACFWYEKWQFWGIAGSLNYGLWGTSSAGVHQSHWCKGKPLCSGLELLPPEPYRCASVSDVSWLTLPWLLWQRLGQCPPCTPQVGTTHWGSSAPTPAPITAPGAASPTACLIPPCRRTPAASHTHSPSAGPAAVSPSELHSQAVPFPSVLVLINIFNHLGPRVTSGLSTINLSACWELAFAPFLPSLSYLSFNPCLGFSSHPVVTKFP